ncbi:MAG TPA: MgtC/SapB family protein [Candidatus Baltobacteraceae bacterium]|jgi:putative Mg2+ transporter-C (MgtC) family protein
MIPTASTTDIIVRLFAATVLGAIVGIERERAEHVAGLRTHALVSLGAALFMIISAYGFASVLGDHVVLDPSRIAAQVASGIGFLGAGTIILRREIVRGLTTAASVWTVAAIGLACGAAMYLAAIIASVLVLVVLAAMRPLEVMLFGSRRSVHIIMTCSARGFAESQVRQIISDAGGSLQRIHLHFDNEKERDRIELVMRYDPAQVHRIADALRALDGVREIRTIVQGSTRER